MAIYDTYIQQLSFNGTEYVKGPVIDLLDTFKIVAQEFPFQRFPEPKELPTRDWAGEDGLDVYVPKELPVKSYEIEVDFLYKGDERSIRSDLSAFIDFLYGRNANAIGSRLAIYNNYTGIGRKDVVVSKIEDDIFYVNGDDPDSVARFKVKFMVYDPVTGVNPMYGMVDGELAITDLDF